MEARSLHARLNVSARHSHRCLVRHWAGACAIDRFNFVMVGTPRRRRVCVARLSHPSCQLRYVPR